MAAELIARNEPWTTLGTTLENCLWFCKNVEYVVFVARKDGTPCGAMVIHPRGLASSPYLKSIVVEEEYRDKGIGRALLKHGEDHFRSVSRHFFYVSHRSIPGQRLCMRNSGIRKLVSSVII